MTGTHIVGTGITPFGRFPNENLRSMATQAVADALLDAGVTADEVGIVFFGNAVGGLITGQEMIRGQAALRQTDLLGKPIVNVENACASSSTAVMLAVTAVQAGLTDIAVAVGAEKLTHPDKTRSFDAIGTAVDLFEIDRITEELSGTTGSGTARSLFMDIYAAEARAYLDRTDATVRDFAEVAVKSHAHGALNPRAQYRNRLTVEDVLNSRVIADPLHLLMCSPIGDGAAAVVVASADRAKRCSAPTVAIRSSILVSGTDHAPGEPNTVMRAAAAAYEQSGIDPSDVDVIELHDAASPAELIVTEELGLAAPGEGVALLRSGATALGGSKVINPSGGLLSRGHPIGATGCAQLVELADQLRGRCGPRQVHGARIGLAENAGGWLGPDNAVTTVMLLSV